MNIQIIKDTSHPLYHAFLSIYETSFPLFEQRTSTQIKEAFKDNRYHLDIYMEDDNEPVGLIAYWMFPTYIYVEHFAISQPKRGQGKGSIILDAFIKQAGKSGRIVILEINPPVDRKSMLRLHFYKRLGMVENPFIHHHPPYREGFKAHELRIMSAPNKLIQEQYKTFLDDLKNVVMNRKM